MLWAAVSGDGSSMSARGFRTKRIRMRRLYTGESYSHLKGSRTPIDKEKPVPAAEADQALLESQVMAHLAHGSDWWAHPVGISEVHIPPGGDVVVYLDGHTALLDGQTFAMSSYAVAHLLPYAEPGIQVSGAPGLRVKAIRGTDLHLTRVGGDSHLVLRGTPGTRWQQELSDRWRSLDSGGYPPLWWEPALSSFERDDEAKHPRVRKRDRDFAWLGSGLLRRVALFHTSNSSYSTRSWLADGEWYLSWTRNATCKSTTKLFSNCSRNLPGACRCELTTRTAHAMARLSRTTSGTRASAHTT
jgi:hypothetical protein